MKNKLSIPLLVALFILMANAACTRKMAPQSASVADYAGIVQVDRDAHDPVYINDVHINVLRSFYKTYGEIPVTKWFRSANGFGVIFKNAGINNTIYYKLNGLVDTEILYYFEDRLSPQV